MQDKRVLTEAYDGIHLHGAQIFESYCRLVGEDKLADRVRTSASRSGGGEAQSEADDSEPEAQVEEDSEPVTVSEPSDAVVDQGTAEP